MRSMNPIAVPVTSVVSAKHVVDETRDEMSECSTHLHGQSLHWGEKKQQRHDLEHGWCRSMHPQGPDEAAQVSTSQSGNNYLAR